jgi:mannose-6-phosphate isomerase-like protein (cupin superfamily)
MVKRYALILMLVLFAAAMLAQHAEHSGKAAKRGQKAAQTEKAAGESVKAFTPDKVEWGAAPDALPSGAQLGVLEGDPMKAGPYTMRLKMPAGYRIPPHFHLRREHVTVVSGNLKVGMGDKLDENATNSFSAGSFAYLEPRTHHYALADGETIIQLHGMGPWGIQYVNASDDPRKNK